MTEQERNRSRQEQNHNAAELRRVRSWLWIVTVVLLGVIAINAYPFLRPDHHGVIPKEVLGTWITTEPRYADRAFEIRKDSLVFYIGEGDSTVHSIEGVEVDDLGGPMLLTVHYADEAGPNQFSFYYDPASGGIISFKNQRHMKWNRSTGSA